MKLFEKSCELIGMMRSDEGLLKLQESMLDMKVKRIDRIGPFLNRERGEDSFVAPSECGRLCACIKDAIDGVKNLDFILDEIKYMRGRLVEMVLEMRNAYRPPCFRDDIKKLMGMGCETSEKEVRSVVAAILGYDELPDSFVNVAALEFYKRDFTGFKFGVSGKPTSVKVVIPVEVDYAKNYEIASEVDELAIVPCEDIESRAIPEIKILVSIGAAPESGEYCVHTNDTVVSACRDVDELAEKIEKVISLDVRDKIKKIRDIEDVYDYQDFAHWRALRSADACAKANTKEVDSGEQP